MVKLNGVVFKSKPINFDDEKVKLKTRSQQCIISGNSYNAIMQKQKSYHQQHQWRYQQLAAQDQSILQSPNQQSSLLKSQYAMHQRQQLKTKHQAQQKENKKSLQN